MKTLIIAAGSLIVAGAIAFGMVASNASETQKQFFAKVEAGQVALLMQDMHPALKDQIDEPVMSALVDAINTKLGRLVGVTQTSFKSEVTADGTRVESEATIEFEHGSATSNLVTVDGFLVAFDVTSDHLIDWFEGPATTEIYERLGQTFLTELLSGNASVAHSLCHPNLQKVASAEQLVQMSATIHQKIGNCEAINMLSAVTKQGTNGVELTITFEITTDRLTTSAEVSVAFEGMKGELLGFDVTLPSEG